jgi:hypothetical protein
MTYHHIVSESLGEWTGGKTGSLLSDSSRGGGVENGREKWGGGVSGGRGGGKKGEGQSGVECCFSPLFKAVFSTRPIQKKLPEKSFTIPFMTM